MIQIFYSTILKKAECTCIISLTMTIKVFTKILIIKLLNKYVLNIFKLKSHIGMQNA